MGINAEYMGTDESVEASSEAQLKVLVLTRTSTNMRATILCVLAIMLAYSEGRPNETINSEKKGGRRVRAAEDNDASDGFSFKWRKRRSRPIRAAEDNDVSLIGRTTVRRPSVRRPAEDNAASLIGRTTVRRESVGRAAEDNAASLIGIADKNDASLIGIASEDNAASLIGIADEDIIEIIF